MGETESLQRRCFFHSLAYQYGDHEVCNGSRLFMKQKYSLNVQIIPGERENFEVSEKRFDREVLNAGVTRELRRRQQFENTQDIKKRKIEEKKFRRRFANRNRNNSGPVSWDQYFGGDL